MPGCILFRLIYLRRERILNIELMKKRFSPITLFIITIIGLAFIMSCNKDEWEEHYSGNNEKSDMYLLDAIKQEPELSTFVGFLEEYGLDSLFERDLSYTLFIPDNEAFDAFKDTMTEEILIYHISDIVFLTRNVNQTRKLQNLADKFPVIRKTENGYTFDHIPIQNSSPLFIDGIYYELDQVAIPNLSLYEFTERYSPVIQRYIDLNDSVYLDKQRSTPVGFDSLGNTIYDSVYNSVNLFERDFFPVDSEFRNKDATFVLFTQEQYDQALTQMAEELGPSFTGHEDIPEIWQFDVLLPSVMQNSLFEGRLEYEDFSNKMISITGDTVNVNPSNIDPLSRYECSNGLTYTYLDFEVPRDLYAAELRMNSSDLVDSIGASTFSWKPEVDVWGYAAQPTRDFSIAAESDYVVNLVFPRSYTGEWGMSFRFKNVFPMKYRLEYRANYRPSGKLAVYVNDSLLTYPDRFGREMDDFDTFELRQSTVSVTGERFIPEDGYNIRDYWVDHLTEFGDVEVRFEYTGPGSQESNGFSIDYVSLIPVEEK